MRSIVLAALSALILGCASGSALVVGQTRPAIADHNTILILTEMPEGASQIAVVRASSNAGFTEQQDLDYAVEELKKQAAKVGANVVILTNRSTVSEVIGVPVYGGGTVVGTEQAQVVEGVAAWVE